MRKNKGQQIGFFVLFLLVQSVNTVANCPTFYANDLLQSGKNTVVKGNPGISNNYSFTTALNFSVAPWGVDIAVTTSDIGNFSPQKSSGFRYYIEASPSLTSNSIIYRVIINNDQSWNTIQLSYLACSRADVAVGNFQAPASSWVAASANVFNVYNTIGRALPIDSYYVAVFISGFTTLSNKFGLAINNKVYDVNQKNLSVSFYCVSNPTVITLTISYIIYPVAHPVLNFTFILTPFGSNGFYQMTGPQSFMINNDITYNQWIVGDRYVSCTGVNCPSNQCILKQDCISNNGNIWIDQCIFCSVGISFQNGKCGQTCGPNQVYSNFACTCLPGFTLVGTSCINLPNRICGNNQVYSNTFHACVCALGSYDSNGRLNCVQCPINSVTSSNGKSCICNSTKIWNSNTNICQNRCLGNQQWVNGRCTCPTGFAWFNQVCRLCPFNSESTSDRSSCNCLSSSSYYQPSINICINCNPDNFEVPNEDKSGCSCMIGYVRNSRSNACVLNTAQCKKNEYFNTATSMCTCLSGMVRDDNGNCMRTCGKLQVWNGQYCICQQGSARYGFCRQCPNGSYPNIQGNGCICSSPSQIFFLSSFRCATCISNSVPNPARTSCVCSSGYNVSQNGACVLLTVSMALSLVPTLTLPSQQQLICEANEVIIGDRCVCEIGYALLNDSCTKCPIGSQSSFDQTYCICGAHKVFSRRLFICFDCPPFSFPNSNQSACVCIVGYKHVNHSCVPMGNCGNNQVMNGSKCVCGSGFVVWNGGCKVCPNGAKSSFDQKRCICQNNQIWISKSFVCQNCLSNSSPSLDQLSCQCNSGYKLVKGNCISTRCAQNQLFNGTMCICSAGYALNLGVCTKCPNNSQASQDQSTCICFDGNSVFIQNSFTCGMCSNNSSPSPDQSSCICNKGYTFVNGNCV